MLLDIQLVIPEEENISFEVQANTTLREFITLVAKVRHEQKKVTLAQFFFNNKQFSLADLDQPLSELGLTDKNNLINSTTKPHANRHYTLTEKVIAEHDKIAQQQITPSNSRVENGESWLAILAQLIPHNDVHDTMFEYLNHDDLVFQDQVGPQRAQQHYNNQATRLLKIVRETNWCDLSNYELEKIWGSEPQLRQIQGWLLLPTEQRDPNRLLFKAARLGIMWQFNLALKLGADLNCLSRKGNTPLTIASEKGHLPIVAALLENPKTQINLPDKYGLPALAIASFHGHDKVVAKLANDSRTDVNLTTPEGDNALMWTYRSAAPNPNIISTLLKASINFQQTNTVGETAASLAFDKQKHHVNAAKRGALKKLQEAKAQETQSPPASPRATGTR